MLENYLIILPVGYILFFIFWSYIKYSLYESNNDLHKIIFCPMCAAYLSLLIVGFFIGFPSILLSMMVGMSITGTAFKLNFYLEERGKSFFAQHFLLQLFWTMVGLILLILVINKFY